MTAKVISIITVVALGLLTLRSIHSTPTQSELENLWTSWKAQYGKSYSSQEEDQFRYEVFLLNNDIVNAHNSDPKQTFELGLNKFADLTAEEFKAKYATMIPKEDADDPYCPFADDGCPSWPVTSIATVNWTQAGAVTPVKNQQQCGGCWSFSTTGALEGLYFLNHSTLLSFSEQQIIDCDTSCMGCDGCYFIDWFNYTQVYGSELETDYPFTGQTGTCQYNSSKAIQVNPSGGQCIPPKSVNDLKAAVATQPVSIGVEAGQSAWQLYKKGTVLLGCGAQLDHAVTLIGYGPHEDSKNAWYVKNQWGTDWGEDGYIYLSQEDSVLINDGYGVCGILRCAKIPLNNPN